MLLIYKLDSIFESLLTFRLRNRKLSITESGVAENYILSGDIIVILFGCDIPVVLRPYQGHYEFVSCCYIDGLMQGEGLRGLNSGELKEQRVEIL